jgi:L,D-transpeptidase catalytic domain
MSILKSILGLMAIASQIFGSTLLAQTPESQPTPTPVSPVQKPRVTQGSKWGLCGRKQADSQRSSGFTGDTAGTYIRDIQVDLHSNNYSTVTLNWANGNLSIETLPNQFNASPGAGNCALDCRSIPQSQKPSSHCTPLSPPTYLVQGYDCTLTKYPEAKFVTWFNWEREIAFHSYTVPPYPASHGCVRLLTTDRAAEWIYDNSLAGITQININWDELDLNSKNPSPKCWRGDRLIPRSPQQPK